MCTIVNNGDKLPLYCVFNGRRYAAGTRPGRNTVAYEIQRPEEFGYPASWFDGEIVKPYVEANPERFFILLLDGFKPHKEDALFTTLCAETPNLRKEILPPNCTSFLQPLDVGINGPLRVKLSKLWTNWAVENYQNSSAECRILSLVKPDRVLVSKWLNIVWEKIPKATVFKSFSKPGFPIQDTKNNFPDHFIINENNEEFIVQVLLEEVQEYENNENGFHEFQDGFDL
ncbi:hypothetical protein O9G_000834 [Rozella allomycis CSF55]|uniref:DDE-1 domain-containing protein n=1 Tax=Rozella allomycis (strain CSF55) TaxID=988480 RepID=A0A075AW51_ROZAC|nr:hypothetical protein O9G_000834 [Rozella allomycis CSF55]|eukprot:EPZ32759.1 hypothetical protein O9G_000834 [Rozella allomycis CSF55]